MNVYFDDYKQNYVFYYIPKHTHNTRIHIYIYKVKLSIWNSSKKVWAYIIIITIHISLSGSQAFYLFFQKKNYIIILNLLAIHISITDFFAFIFYSFVLICIFVVRIWFWDVLLSTISTQNCMSISQFYM